MNDIDYIIPILKKYHTAFTNKTYPNIKTNKPDALMDIFGITTELQEKNKQYWGRELGMIWQLLVTEVCKHHITVIRLNQPLGWKFMSHVI